MIEAYPLSWPTGWPRTKIRRNGKFGRGERVYSQITPGSSYTRKRGLSVADGVERVLAELSRLGIDRQDMIVSTNVRTRLDGGPRSGEREPDDPGAAVYWQDRAGNKRVMAIDRYDRVADNLAAIAATLEALRAIERHGGGQILERAFTGFTALPSPDHKRTWREVLGVSADAGIATVAQAYLRLRSETHPDKGGDAGAFDEVQRAYEQACHEVGA